LEDFVNDHNEGAGKALAADFSLEMSQAEIDLPLYGVSDNIMPINEVHLGPWLMDQKMHLTMVDRTALSAAFNNTSLDMQTMKLLPSKGSSNTCDTNPYLSYARGRVMFVSCRTEPIGNCLYILAHHMLGKKE
jgi:hypothetical protein